MSKAEFHNLFSSLHLLPISKPRSNDPWYHPFLYLLSQIIHKFNWKHWVPSVCRHRPLTRPTFYTELTDSVKSPAQVSFHPTFHSHCHPPGSSQHYLVPRLINQPFVRFVKPACSNRVDVFSTRTFYNCCCLVAQSCPTLLWPHGLYPTRLLCPWDFPRQGYWSGLPFPFPGNILDPGIKLPSPALHVDSLPLSRQWSPPCTLCSLTHLLLSLGFPPPGIPSSHLLILYCICPLRPISNASPLWCFPWLPRPRVWLLSLNLSDLPSSPLLYQPTLLPMLVASQIMIRMMVESSFMW